VLRKFPFCGDGEWRLVRSLNARPACQSAIEKSYSGGADHNMNVRYFDKAVIGTKTASLTGQRESFWNSRMAEDVAKELEDAVDRVLASKARKKLVVAGPGAGKTTLFRKLLDSAGGTADQLLVLTFINNLKADLESSFIPASGGSPRVFLIFPSCASDRMRTSASEIRARQQNNTAPAAGARNGRKKSDNKRCVGESGLNYSE
jgi:hypothetical protein